MKGASPSRRPTIRPMPIAAFCEKILASYKPTSERKNYSTFYHVQRVVFFLTQKPSVKTTADLSIQLIGELTGTCGGLSESTRVVTLRYFRRICNLAIEWRCLKQSPFEGYPLPATPSRSFANKPRGRELDDEQVRDILAYLKVRSDTWKGHRLYAFAAVIIYAGLRASEALELKCADCDLACGVIRVPKRGKFIWSMHSPEVQIPRALAEILPAWFNRRGQGKPAWAAQVRYGTRLADDGRTLIPHEAELTVLADMRRWQSEGWSLKRIARELDSRGIPTKLGRAKQWSPGSVDVILKRAGQPNADVAVAAEGSKGQEDDSGWVFPTTSGRAHWSRTDRPGYTALDQLRDVGKALEIEGLTTESLRRFHLEHTRPTLDLKWDERETRAGLIETAVQRITPIELESPTPVRRCPVELRGEGIPLRVYGAEIPRLSGVAYTILAKLVERFHQGGGCTPGELEGLTSSERPLRLFALALDRQGFEPLRRIIPSYKGGRGKIVEIVDIGPEESK